MSGEFKHPLARAACLRHAVGVDGSERLLLVVVTTLQLDPEGRGYKKAFVDKLSHAAREYLSRLPNPAGFVLINRLRDWQS